MLSRAPVLLAVPAIWAWAVFRWGGVVAWDRKLYLLALGAAGLWHWLANRRTSPGVPASLLWPACLLPAWVALQCIPLPPPAIAVLSPARAELWRAASVLAPHSAVTISVVPGVTASHLLLICAYALIFLLLYQAGPAWAGRRWLLILPPAAVALVQAAMGILQAAAGEPAHGSYVNRDHYAGLLEMVLPFCLVGPILLWHGGSDRPSVRRVLAVCACCGAAAAMLAGGLLSLSRMGFLAPLFSVLVMGTVAWSGGGWRRVAAVALLACFLGACFVWLPSDQLIGRFAESSTDSGTGGRITLWRESLSVVRAFPILGCGLGGYESAFLRYKVSLPMVSDDHPHNDYLQFLIELGIAGFAIGAVLFTIVLARTARAAARHNQPRDRLLAIACLGAFAAIGLHSLVDFNLYIPANAMLLAWIAGMAAGLPPAPGVPGPPARVPGRNPALATGEARP